MNTYFTPTFTHESVLTNANISVAAPATGGTPQNTITGTNYYTGIISWNGNPNVFLGSTVYTATITLTATGGATFDSSFTPTVSGGTVNNISVASGSVTFAVTFAATNAHWTDNTGSANSNDNNNSGSNYTQSIANSSTVTFYGQNIGYILSGGVLTVNISAQESRKIVNSILADVDGNKTVKLSWNGLSGASYITNLKLTFDASMLKANENVTFIIAMPFGTMIFTTEQMLAWFGGNTFGKYTVTLEKSSLKIGVTKDGKGVSWDKLTPMAQIGVPYNLKSGENSTNIVITDKNGRVLPTSVCEKGMVYADIYALGTYKAVAAMPVAFTDTSGHWAKASIDYVTIRGLINGSGNTAYSPETAITRAEYLAALGKLASANVSGYKESRFTDVSNDSVYMPYIEWAASNGIVVGIGDNKFAPDAPITREEMAQMMVNYAKTLGYSLPNGNNAVIYADDTDISGWAVNAVAVMQKADIMTGKVGNRFDPQGNTTKAEAATILRRFVEREIEMPPFMF